MSNKIENIIKKNHAYYFFYDIIDVKNLDLNGI